MRTATISQAVHDLIRRRGWRIKAKGDEITVRECPLCGKAKEHFKIWEESGRWHAFCDGGRKGDLRELLEIIGEPEVRARRSEVRLEEPEICVEEPGESAESCIHVSPISEYLPPPEPKSIPMEWIEGSHKKLLADEKALTYLTSRKWSLEAIRYFKIGLTRRQGTGHKLWFMIPHLSDGTPKNVKFRSLPDADKREFHRIEGCPTVLFNPDAIKKHQEIILCEGEPDAIALWSHGFENVVATTAGAGHLPAEAIDALGTKKKVYIAYDTDYEGKIGAAKAARRIGIDRCYALNLPSKDVNEFLIAGGTAEEFAKLLKEARRFDVEHVKSLADAVDLLEEELFLSQGQAGLVPPWPEVARITGDFEAGDLIVMSGKPGTGKTTFAMNILYSLARLKKPGLLFCLEMRPARIVRKVISYHRGISQQSITPEILAGARGDFAETPLYLGYISKKPTPKDVFETIRQAVRRYDVGIVVFDHLHFLVRNTRYITQEVGVLTQEFKILAEELHIPIILIVHPRKSDPGQIISGVDLKDNASVEGDPDVIVILHRNSIVSRREEEAMQEFGLDNNEVMDTMSPICLVRVVKGRFRGTGQTLLYYEGAHSTFRTATREEKQQHAPPDQQHSRGNGVPRG